MIKIKEIFSVCNGKIFSDQKMLEQDIAFFRIDSRTVCENDCFVAIKGERTDGNLFIDEAIKNGAKLIITEENFGEDILEKAAVLQTKNIENTLLKIAAYYREKGEPTVIAVSGSVGKTTVKELIFGVLNEKTRTHKTEGNYNNTLGLPLSILARREEIFSVLELGISEFGEMKELSFVAKPNICVLTNIGEMHLENFKNRNNLAKEKLKIISHMKPNGSLIIPHDEPLLANSDQLPKNTLTVSNKNRAANYFIEVKQKTISGSVSDIFVDQTLKYRDVFVPILGEHGVVDCGFAVAVADLLGLSEDEIKSGLSSYSSCGLRQKIIEDKGRLIMCDCYNSGPMSMLAALDAFSEMCKQRGCERKTILFGSMLELGKVSEAEHIKLGELIASMKIDNLITVGKEAVATAKSAINSGLNSTRVHVFEDYEHICEPVALFKKLLGCSDAVLIKGSRRMRLERFLDSIT